MHKRQTEDIASALALLTAEVKDLRLCVNACECRNKNEKGAKTKPSKNSSSSSTLSEVAQRSTHHHLLHCLLIHWFLLAIIPTRPQVK